MSYKKLPKPVFQSPLVEFANFADGSHINLIKLAKPLANGNTWAIHHTTFSLYCRNGLFKSFDDAKLHFNHMVTNAKKVSPLINIGLTGN